MGGQIDRQTQREMMRSDLLVQGTRLGTPDPKGCYDIGLPSSSSLFELMAARLSSLRCGQNIVNIKHMSPFAPLLARITICSSSF